MTTFLNSNILKVYFSLYAIATLLSTYVSSYYGIAITSSLSYNVNDGWCEPTTSGIGSHCFGDFYYPLKFVNMDNPWNQGANPYPPFMETLLKPLAFLVERFSSNVLVLMLYIFLLIVCILFVPFYLFTKRRISKVDLLILSTLSFSAAPVIVSLDRGNNILFSIPFIYLFLQAELEGFERKSFLYWVILLVMKPQFFLFGLIFLRNRDIKRFIWNMSKAIIAFFATFLLYPSDVIANIKSYFNQISTYQDYATRGNLFPVNVSLDNGITLILNKVFDVNYTVMMSMILTFLVLICTAWKVFFSKDLSGKTILLVGILPILLPRTTFHYYLVILIPIFYILLNHFPNTEFKMKDRNDNRNLFIGNGFRYVYILACAIMIPWNLPWALFTPSSSSLDAYTVSAHWTIALMICSVILFTLLITKLSRETKKSIRKA